MPIYEYRCSSCGHQQDFLQKLSDAPLKRCTACGQETFSKMLTAAGFLLKGSGWYVTDFKGSGSKPATKYAESGASDSPKAEAKSEAKAEGKSEGKSEAKSEAKSEGKSEGKSEAKAEAKSEKKSVVPSTTA